MNYTILPSVLHETADEIYSYLTKSFGIRRVSIEKSTIPDVDFHPTLCGKSPFGYYIYVEVSNSPYPPSLYPLLVDCLTTDIPIKLYVANPASESGKIDEKEVRRLSRNWIGYLIVGSSRVEEIRDAAELSLYLPETLLKSVPTKLRPTIKQAYNTYRNGNPVKGVSAVCDEIEHLIRRIGKKALKNGKFPPSFTMSFDKPTTSVSSIIDCLRKYQILNSSLIGKCSGYPNVRNDKNHPIKNLKKRIERHKKLKTNFNWSIDLLIWKGSVHRTP